MAWIPIVLSVASTVMNMQAQEKEKDAIKAANIKRAQQYEDKAKEAVAAGQRAMLEERRQKRLIASRALAVASASGGGAFDPSVINIIGDIDGEGAYRESVAMYQGEQEALDLRLQAASLREGVDYMESAYKTRQTATLLRGASSAYSAYASAYPSKPSGSQQDRMLREQWNYG